MKKGNIKSIYLSDEILEKIDKKNLQNFSDYIARLIENDLQKSDDKKIDDLIIEILQIRSQLKQHETAIKKTLKIAAGTHKAVEKIIEKTMRLSAKEIETIQNEIIELANTINVDDII